LVESLKHAQGLLYRFQHGEGFQRYVKERMPLVGPAVGLMLLTSVAFAASTVVFLAGTRFWLGLPALILSPFILVGSFAVQAFVFFSWIEGRALALALGHRAAKPGRVAVWISRNLRADMGAVPPVPWILAAIFVLVPLIVLSLVSAKAAAVLVALHVIAPIFYARFDR
jgi:hypothetical protein